MSGACLQPVCRLENGCLLAGSHRPSVKLLTRRLTEGFDGDRGTVQNHMALEHLGHTWPRILLAVAAAVAEAVAAA
jgi:hypothetical protein